MPKESIVEIPEGSGNKYRYVYEDGSTRYLGPVGSSPDLGEEEFNMVIKAKYRGTCPVCKKPIRPGQDVEWEPGQKARHVQCAKEELGSGWWVYEVNDPRILGYGRGRITEKPFSGPYDTRDEARDEQQRLKQGLRFAGSPSMYYVVKEVKGKPVAKDEPYEHERGEFEDW